MIEIAFESLASADLIVDALYRGGRSGHVGDDPLSRLVGVGTQGGFRQLGRQGKTKYCVLYSSLTDADWPDALYPESGRFIYYGDNKVPGKELHDTKQRGNRILQRAYDDLAAGQRESIPPFLVFTKGVEGRDVYFRGLAVPGAPDVVPSESLVAVWRSKSGQRFQNYRSTFTILDVPVISRSWLEDLKSGNPQSSRAPEVWRRWVEGGVYTALLAPPTKRYRSRAEQMPQERDARRLVQALVDYFGSHPRGAYAFEECAVELARMMLPAVSSVEMTRPSADGGRDAIGTYRIGTPENGVHLTFALEAKCWSMDNGCGVGETKRLISRIRHREFGVFVTTSFVSEQAYREIADDRAPVVVVSGGDIAKLLRDAGYGTPAQLNHWLRSRFAY